MTTCCKPITVSYQPPPGWSVVSADGVYDWSAAKALVMQEFGASDLPKLQELIAADLLHLRMLGHVYHAAWSEVARTPNVIARTLAFTAASLLKASPSASWAPIAEWFAPLFPELANPYLLSTPAQGAAWLEAALAIAAAHGFPGPSSPATGPSFVVPLVAYGISLAPPCAVPWVLPIKGYQKKEAYVRGYWPSTTGPGLKLMSKPWMAGEAPEVAFVAAADKEDWRLVKLIHEVSPVILQSFALRDWVSTAGLWTFLAGALQAEIMTSGVAYPPGAYSPWSARALVDFWHASGPWSAEAGFGAPLFPSRSLTAAADQILAGSSYHNCLQPAVADVKAGLKWADFGSKKDPGTPGGRFSFLALKSYLRLRKHAAAALVLAGPTLDAWPALVETLMTWSGAEQAVIDHGRIAAGMDPEMAYADASVLAFGRSATALAWACTVVTKWPADFIAYWQWVGGSPPGIGPGPADPGGPP